MVDWRSLLLETDRRRGLFPARICSSTQRHECLPPRYVTIARLGKNHYRVGANGALDTDWFNRFLPEDGSVPQIQLPAGEGVRGLLDAVPAASRQVG